MVDTEGTGTVVFLPFRWTFMSSRLVWFNNILHEYWGQENNRKVLWVFSSGSLLILLILRIFIIISNQDLKTRITLPFFLSRVLMKYQIYYLRIVSVRDQLHTNLHYIWYFINTRDKQLTPVPKKDMGLPSLDC